MDFNTHIYIIIIFIIGSVFYFAFARVSGSNLSPRATPHPVRVPNKYWSCFRVSSINIPLSLSLLIDTSSARKSSSDWILHVLQTCETCSPRMKPTKDEIYQYSDQTSNFLTSKSHRLFIWLGEGVLWRFLRGKIELEYHHTVRPWHWWNGRHSFLRHMS